MRPYQTKQWSENMQAFIRKGDVLIRCYNMGDDWQTVDNLGNERWCPNWCDNSASSMVVAIQRHALEVFGLEVTEKEIVKTA
jgi:hypothetical protein